jgi:hypothetical protein
MKEKKRVKVWVSLLLAQLNSEIPGIKGASVVVRYNDQIAFNVNSYLCRVT